MGNRRRHIGSSLAALTLTLSLLTGLLTGCGPGGSQSSSPEAGSTPPAASQSTQTPEQPALPELTTDTYGNAAVGYQAAVVSANEYTSRIGMDILEAGGNAVDAAVAMIFANSLTEPGATSLGGASFMTIYLRRRASTSVSRPWRPLLRRRASTLWTRSMRRRGPCWSPSLDRSTAP